MKYQAFTANINGLEKKLGVVGTYPLYTKKESELAREIVSEYDLIAMQGRDDAHKSVVRTLEYIPAEILIIPSLILGLFETNRKFSNPDIAQYAKRFVKRTAYLNNPNLPLVNILGLTAMAALNIPIAPIEYIDRKINGDPTEFGTKGYYRELNKKNTISKILNQIVEELEQVDNADRIMTRNAYSLISDTRNKDLLISCYHTHFEGIIKNLQENTKLTQTENIIV